MAESCTAGLVAHRVTAVPGSSAYFLGGVVAYADRVKTAQLGVRPDTLKTHGAVSRRTAVEMAQGVRRRLKADIGLGITGIAGPGGGTRAKPVGLVWIAVAEKRRRPARRFILAGSRAAVRRQAAAAALELLHAELT